MFELIRPGTQIDFAGKRHIFTTISAIAVLASIVLFFTKGLNYGIDFTGGAEVQIKVPKTWDIGKVRDELETDSSLKGLKVIQIGEPESHEFLVKVQGEEKTLNKVSAGVQQTLSKTLKPGEFEIQRTDVVGPAAGSSLRTSGFLSMFYALIGILIYVSVRFDMRYSPGAVLALFHDSMITIGVLIILGKQFDLLTLAALLALIGYSNNDTIIVYDRVRETLHQHPNMPVTQAVNIATNETLGRTILTSLTTLFSAAALWLFGGPVIHDFAFTFLIGIIVGSYSSIFVASAFMIYITEWKKRREGKMKSKPGKSKVNVRPEPKFQS